MFIFYLLFFKYYLLMGVFIMQIMKITFIFYFILNMLFYE